MVKVEVKVWENKEFGLTYVENRAFENYDNEDMIDAYLSVVITESGEDFNLNTMFEGESDEVTVDDIEWTLVETLVNDKVSYDKYKEYFVSGFDYINL